MDSFIISAGIGISDKEPVEERIEDAIDGTMDYSVSHSRFMDISWLWVGNIEGFVTRVVIGLERELSMECQ